MYFLAMATVSSEGSTMEGSNSKLTHEVVGRPEILVDFWTEGLISDLAAVWTLSSDPCHVGLFVEHRAALLAAGFPHGE